MRVGAPGVDRAAGGGERGCAGFWLAGGAGCCCCCCCCCCCYCCCCCCALEGLYNRSTRWRSPPLLCPDSTVETPVVRFTTMRSPRSTLAPCVTTTLPV